MIEREEVRKELEDVLEEKEKCYGKEEKKEIIEETLERLVEKDEGKISRRNFLKIAGLGAGGLALSTLTSAGWIRNSTEGADGFAKTLSQDNSAGEHNLDMNQNQILNQVLDRRTNDPSNPVNAQIWFRADLD